MDKLHFFLERCYRMTSIPMRILNVSTNITLYSRGSNEEYNLFDDALKDTIVKKAEQIMKPFLEFESDIICYGVMPYETNTLLIAGPILLYENDELMLKRYAQRHNTPYDSLPIKSKTLIELCSILTMIHGIRTGEELSEADIILQATEQNSFLHVNENDYNEYIMRSADEEVVRLSYKEELRFLKSIQDGSVEDLTSVNMAIGSTSVYLQSIGKMANTSTKNLEYMVCTSIVLATRAAIEGGMDPKKSYAISDLYMQRLAKCKSMGDFLALHCDMRLEYARQVRKIKENRSKISYVEKAKHYINSHLNQPYKLDDIVAELGVSKVYLSKKFNEEMGMSVMRYANKCRIEAAAYMLKYSNESISYISGYLCFQSQSHFGTVFKDFIGTTPQKYRENEQPIE